MPAQYNAALAQAVSDATYDPNALYGSYDPTQQFLVSQNTSAANDSQWTLPYTPRQALQHFHKRTQRFAFLICHRRCGKTVACVAELVLRAIYTKKKNAQYAYICPFRSQAKAVAWNYLVEMTAGLAVDVRVSELSVTLPNGAKIWLSGSDNVNALRGIYLDGAVLDEFAQCRPDLLEAVIMPCLLDRKGWLVIIGTAYGRLNQFYEYYEKSKTDPNWFHADIKIYDSHVIPLDEQERIKGSISDAKWRQEFLNDFSAELVGTYYASLINEAEQNHRISDLINVDYALPTHVSFDIGRGDNTAVWFWQETPHGINVIDFYQTNGQPAQHYIDYLKGTPYKLATINLPHDAKAKTFATQKSTLEQFVHAFEANPDIQVQIVPRLSVEDGIEAVRQILPYTHFLLPNTFYGVECLRVYRKQYDEKNRCFSNTPLHDYSSDAADSFRYLAIMAKKRLKKAPTPYEALENQLVSTQNYSLNDLFTDREQFQNRGYIAKHRI